jgi:hypothetical protein
MRLLTLDASYLFNAISRQALSLRRTTDTTDERENRRRHECDRGATSNDQDATALSRCEEFADIHRAIAFLKVTATNEGGKVYVPKRTFFAASQSQLLTRQSSTALVKPDRGQRIRNL